MKKGFTLIELLVVVLIIGILSSVALPQYNRAVERARATEAVVQMDALTQAIDRFVLANGFINKSGSELLKSLDIELPDSNKFDRQPYCSTYSCYINIMSEKRDYQLHAYRAKGSRQWNRYCYYQTSLGKGVCEGLRGAGYTVSESSF